MGRLSTKTLERRQGHRGVRDGLLRSLVRANGLGGEMGPTPSRPGPVGASAECSRLEVQGRSQSDSWNGTRSGRRAVSHSKAPAPNSEAAEGCCDPVRWRKRVNNTDGLAQIQQRTWSGRPGVISRPGTSPATFLGARHDRPVSVEEHHRSRPRPPSLRRIRRAQPHTRQCRRIRRTVEPLSSSAWWPIQRSHVVLGGCHIADRLATRFRPRRRVVARQQLLGRCLRSVRKGAGSGYRPGGGSPGTHGSQSFDAGHARR